MSVFGGAMGVVVASGVALVLLAAVKRRPRDLIGALKELEAPETATGQVSREWALATLENRSRGVINAADLAVIGKTRVEVITQAAVSLAVGVAVVLVTTSLKLAGLVPGGWLVPIAAIVLGLAAPWAVISGVRSAGEAARAETREALVAWIDFVAMAAHFHSVEEAMYLASKAGAGSERFDAFKAAIEEAHIEGLRAWDGIAKLGARIRVRELVEVSQTLSYAGTEGTQVREVLAARATSLADNAAAQELADANRASARMQAPIGLTTLAIFGLLMYPAVGLLQTTGL